MNERDEQLWRLAAESEIRFILATYCRAVDRADEALLRDVYHEGAIDDHGRFFTGPAAEFAIACTSGVRELHHATMHQISNARIVVNEMVAAAETYVVAAHLRRDLPEILLFAGRYLDRFEHRHGAWKIAHRLTVLDWDLKVRNERGMPAGWFGNAGARSQEDPSYGLFASVAEGRPWP